MQCFDCLILSMPVAAILSNCVLFQGELTKPSINIFSPPVISTVYSGGTGLPSGSVPQKTDPSDNSLVSLSGKNSYLL